jgi:hypothetical protein
MGSLRVVRFVTGRFGRIAEWRSAERGWEELA